MAQQRFVPSAAMADPSLAPAYIALCARYGIEMLPTDATRGERNADR
jgi:hypothetical protein